MAQVPPNIMIAVVCYHLWNTLQKVPQSCNERWYTMVASGAILAGGAMCLLVFPPWAIPRMMNLWAHRLPVDANFPMNTSILHKSAPTFQRIGNLLDLIVECVEMSVGRSGLMSVWLPLQQIVVVGPGELLVLIVVEIGQRHRVNPVSPILQILDEFTLRKVQSDFAQCRS